ncbi:hypothetical protein MKW98_010603 [Papaver atlanticum]|uniref:GIR1-like zinc ribbon domain-containing protein n=1 Tax=Papaver atlanticum TaxID=357466 RepID=A0AAD4S331_9MAGN|nr:hypothetical protein MKW98_010603 [Papaver atlanticum]
MSERKEKIDIDCASSKIDLKLDFSPSVLEQRIITTTSNSSTSSPTSSCVLSEKKRPDNDNSNNLEETTTMVSDMVLVGCPGCYLYLLLLRDNIRCPKCKSSDFIYITKNNIISRNN